ncbi:curli-like amyloid fiber formation chaperone CsgH [Sulfitobacter guttiformis]|uniref:Uncharacterized protein n=1 Tax=Sulfitobacter guttiformis TaxID=74349 RepID=A0A420DK77_9RHOB|nr:curli-like amyloid fiber formation chaperone CsgH [Sulfitobacter guttiformis]KIN71522.1 hypothetical protein Z949_683 [Sulfitobacter guttiformis KCTC 32187]RKE94640.1 hypothetical protein C8N30_3771 [Sulfitobacter guttiformis]
MTLPPIAPFAALLMALPHTAAACDIALVQQDGHVSVTAEITPHETGNLSYTVSSIVMNGSNRSQSMNGGTVDVTADAGTVTVWRGQIYGDAGTRMTVAMDARLNARTYSCSAQFP